MRILFLFNDMTHYYNRIVSRINRLPNVEVLYVVPKGFEKNAEIGAVYQTKDKADFKYIELPFKRGIFGLSFASLRALIKKEKIDSMLFTSGYMHDLFFNPLLLFQLYRKKIKLILKSIPYQLEPYDQVLQSLKKEPLLYRQSYNWLKLQFHRFTFRMMDAHICYIPEAYQIYGSYGVDPKRIVISFNSPDTDEFFKIRKEIMNSANRPVQKDYKIIHVGRLVKWKRVDLLIEAVSFLEKKYPKIELDIIGYGPEEESLKTLAHQKQVEARTHFLGGIYDPIELGRILMSSSIYILAGIGGISINDAMCFGLPIICSMCDGTEKVLVKDGVNGLFFKPGSLEDLIDKIRYLFDNQDKRREMGKASVSIIEKEINIHTLLSGYKRVFDIVRGNSLN